MKAQVLQSWGGRLTLVDRPRPTPQAGEVLVAGRADGAELYRRPDGTARDAAADPGTRDHRRRRRGRTRGDRGPAGRPRDGVLLPDVRAMRVLPDGPGFALPGPPGERGRPPGRRVRGVRGAPRGQRAAASG